MGFRFEYRGENDEACASCKLRRTCQNLEVGRTYRVVGVRPVKHDVCTVFEGLVQIVEVEPEPLDLSLPAHAVQGTAHTHHFEECGAVCIFRPLCNPPHIREGERVRFVEVREPIPCKVGRDLRRGRVERIGP